VEGLDGGEDGGSGAAVAVGDGETASFMGGCRKVWHAARRIKAAAG
jgi:hypothetical protein